jgi:hypothetical protein
MIRYQALFRLLLMLSALALPQVVQAQGADPKTPSDSVKAEAAQRFDRGLQLFDEGDNAAALAEFKRTYEIAANPLVRYNIGLVYAAMGRPVDAVDALESLPLDSLSAEQRERATKTLSEQRARTGRIMVTSKPENARIEVDGVEVAKTPLSAPMRVAAGARVIGVTASGFAPARREILLAGESETAVHFDLIPLTSKRLANLTIHSRTFDAQVLVNGKPAGKTPLESSLPLPPGRHVVELRRPGYVAVRRETELAEGGSGELSFDLAIDPAALAEDGALLVLDPDQPNPLLYVDGRRVGVYSAPMRLPRGRHRLRLEAPGYLPYEREVTLDPQEREAIRVSFEPTPQTRDDKLTSARFHRTGGIIGMIAGSVIAAGGATFLIINAGAKSDAEDEYAAAQRDLDREQGPCDIPGGALPAECNAYVAEHKQKLDDTEARDVIGYVGIGVGAAVLATGVVLLVTGEDTSRYERPRSARRPAPRLLVSAGPGIIGAGLELRL